MEIIKWDRLRDEISNATDIIHLSKLKVGIEAMEKWAKQSNQSLETQNQIAEYRLRLDRKRGEWIEANIPEGGQLLRGQKRPRETATLSQVGS